VSEKKFKIGRMIRLCEEEGVTVSVITDFPVGSKTHVQLRMVHSLPLLTLSGVSYRPWQVDGRNEISDFDEWAKLDLEYIDNWSLWLDLRILFKTVGVVLSGSGR